MLFPRVYDYKLHFLVCLLELQFIDKGKNNQCMLNG